MSENFPYHVAIIMDGNGRWAKQQGKNRTYGHYIGSNVVDKIVEAAIEEGVKYLTLYTFSTENWKRPKSEIRFLMFLLKKQLIKKRELFLRKNVKFNVIGDIDVFEDEIKENINQLIEITENNTGLRVSLALNYGGRYEIVRASKEIARKVKEGLIEPDEIDEKLFAQHLYTYDMPDVDLLIRTGGEKRVSNFLLWQISYGEFVFFDKHWPEFSSDDLKVAIEEFKRRKRKFGGL
ncbi:isoprenyl transferase [Hippea maritima]|uniref:Isoprenyl transferase n=1 Tax=Hippea maritima (strain ATCC 700847 / DSM 10411 / MH2) TaxID=760142 RepID=F2LTT8_HIPMA|nr:isoprenyl transferase [Hippea maritima]AEA34464.1 Undecaprenyl pyrophosphate synthase [Hippea maritima DSM 10411]